MDLSLYGFKTLFEGKSQQSQGEAMNESAHSGPHARREPLISKTWIQAVVMVMLFGFFELGFLAYRTHTGEAPILAKAVAGANMVFVDGPTEWSTRWGWINGEAKARSRWNNDHQPHRETW